jgi:hypothetical protein
LSLGELLDPASLLVPPGLPSQNSARSRVTESKLWVDSRVRDVPVKLTSSTLLDRLLKRPYRALYTSLLDAVGLATADGKAELPPFPSRSTGPPQGMTAVFIVCWHSLTALA